MRRLFFASGLLLVMLAGCLLNAWYAQRITDDMVQALSRAQQEALSGNWERAEEITLRAYEAWDHRGFYLHVIMRHSDADQILRSFRSVLQYLDIQEVDQYAAANADLIVQLELLAEMEQAELTNVL